MRIALVILCVGAVAFLMRVLSALVKEFMFPMRRMAYRASLRPLGRRGELIEMTPRAFTRSLPLATGRKVALGLLAILGLAKIESINTILGKF